MGALSLEGKHLLPPHLLGRHWNCHADLALERQQRGSRTDMGALLTPPVVPTTAANTPRGTTALGCRQHPSLSALQTCTSASFQKVGAPSDSCPQIPLQSTGQEAQPTLSEPPLPCCCWQSQQPDKSPKPTRCYHTSGPPQTKHSLSNLYDL